MWKKIVILFLLISTICMADKVKIIRSDNLKELEKKINEFIVDKKVKDISIEVEQDYFKEVIISVKRTFEYSNKYIACITYEVKNENVE